MVLMRLLRAARVFYSNRWSPRNLIKGGKYTPETGIVMNEAEVGLLRSVCDGAAAYDRPGVGQVTTDMLPL